MSTKTGWHKQSIASLFSSSRPGEWGTDGTRDTGTPVLRSTNFCDDGTIDYSDIAYRTVPKTRLDARRITAGTILIEKAGGSTTRPAGRVVYCDHEFGGTASNFVEVVQVEETRSPKYVFYLLYNNFHSGLVYKYQQQTTGIINFKLGEYGSETVSVPESRAEQAKIAEVLSTVDRAIAQTEALIAKQQRIKTGLMQDLLTRGIDEHGTLRSEATHAFKDSPLGRIPVEWELRELGEVIDLQVGYAFKSSWFSESGIRLMRGENVGAGEADWSDAKHLPKELVEKYREYFLDEGDMIIGMDRTFTKQGFKVTRLRRSDVPCLLVQRVGRFTAKEIPSEYMQLWIQSPRYQHELLLQQKGMDIPHLSRNEILSPLIPFPNTTSEMDNIGKRYQAMESTLDSDRRQLEKLQHLKTGLMQDLLTGKVRVTPLLEQSGVTT